jgi:hypothetical protein
MCMGGGKSADDYYDDIKVEAKPLPSLVGSGGGRRQPTYGNVRASGKERRTLLLGSMMGLSNVRK